MRAGRFFDGWRGNGVHLSVAKWTIALRWCWRMRFVRPPGKAGYARLYIGPLEVEYRKTHNV